MYLNDTTTTYIVLIEKQVPNFQGLWWNVFSFWQSTTKHRCKWQRGLNIIMWRLTFLSWREEKLTTNQMALVSTNPSVVSNRFLLRNGQLWKRRKRCGEVNSDPASNCIYYILVYLVCMFFLLLSLYVCFSACSGCMNFFARELFRVWIFFLSSPFTFPMAHPLKLNGPWKV